jgi:hypothetical protein
MLDLPGTRTEITQLIAADPTSTALLLAGPTAFELWPGVQRIKDVDGGMLVEAALDPERVVDANVRALPPQRTPTSFVTRFTWSGPGLPTTTGELTLSAAPARDGERATHAVLVLLSEGLELSALNGCQLEVMARGFLANLARAAELRNRAA